MKNLNIILIVLIFVVGGVGFLGGMKYQQSKRTISNRQFVNGQFGNGQGARNGQNGNRMGFRPVSGEIISSDDKSITVKLADGSSKIVLLSDKTEINQAASATKEDLKTGEKVMVVGTDNSDGSVTAQNIQLNPIIRQIPPVTPMPTK